MKSETTALKGFRLIRLEALNWGTFDKQIWTLTAEGGNSLLTGNIGSGKSTLVDALTTLLVPPRKLAYNKAAGAEEKERSAESYFYGHYTSVQDDNGKARAKGLRQTGNHCSIIMAVFYAESLQQYVSLAQIFWLKPGDTKVKRLYIVASRELAIAEDFSGFGSKINELRKKLRKDDKLDLADNFPPYQLAFSRLLGLGSDGRALELFNQTISMKSVGSVTDFVRQNMLEQPDIEKQLAELERNYDDLHRLHDAVVAARQKIQLLEPVSRYGEGAKQAAQERDTFDSARSVLEPYMAGKAIPLYQSRLARQQQDLTKLGIQLSAMDNQSAVLQQRIEQIRDDINGNGGSRLQQLSIEIKQKEAERDDFSKNYQRYQGLSQALELDSRLDPAIFVSNIAQAKVRAEEVNQQLDEHEQSRDALNKQLWQKQEEQNNVGDELKALNKRQSNIPLRQLSVREQICAELGVGENELPFVGELLQVKADEQQWQGAIERVLHGFALSLVVPDQHYQRVSDFIEKTHLGARLVYYRVKPVENLSTITSPPNSLPTKVEIKPDSTFYAWLNKEIKQRFTYQCCDSLVDFRRSERALTLNGQVKSGPDRHEKDDRHNIQDKSRYVLGWSNKEKIQLLATQYSHLQSLVATLNAELSHFRKQKEQLDELRRKALLLADFNYIFAQINWPKCSEEVETLRADYQRLEASSEQLKLLNTSLDEARAELKAVLEQRDAFHTERAKLEQKIETHQEELKRQQESAVQATPEQQDEYYPLLEEMYQRYGAGDDLRIEMLVNQSSLLRGKMNDKIQHLEARRTSKQESMIAAMGDFVHAFPNDATDFDRTLAALGEYQQLLQQLQQEDLPRHEERFKEMLNRDTIRAMALFRSQLDKQEEEIKSRILLINQSLQDLDYQPGTYIEVMGVLSPDIDIREFKQRLKQCVEYSTDDNLYSEQKFEQVKSLIEQMRNQPKWTQKVVDVRFWFLFNVIERYREDNSEKECYSDSGGKSGGQKEKLAYAILAAAIMLQYRLVDENNAADTQRRFNLVVIDEAFARGSKDSTRFGLELFKTLGLQLLLVTPLQKLDVIESYVSHVHFVDQKDNRSMVLNMTIEDYRERLNVSQKLQQYSEMVEDVTDDT
ncbi:ATP-binding protein [Dryocola clanedunensis]|uniref:ATP-binding protein n=1 Tax=Cedecea sulfonylureivorans TaxID=3051154 RepID=UPI001925FF70|nr:ATP-binding protein [Cedecea sulfonylureivorans]